MIRRPVPARSRPNGPSGLRNTARFRSTGAQDATHRRNRVCCRTNSGQTSALWRRSAGRIALRVRVFIRTGGSSDAMNRRPIHDEAIGPVRVSPLAWARSTAAESASKYLLVGDVQVVDALGDAPCTRSRRPVELLVVERLHEPFGVALDGEELVYQLLQIRWYGARR